MRQNHSHIDLTNLMIVKQKIPDAKIYFYVYVSPSLSLTFDVMWVGECERYDERK